MATYGIYGRMCDKKNNLMRFRLSGSQFYNVCKLIERDAKDKKEFIEKYAELKLKIHNLPDIDPYPFSVPEDYLLISYMTAHGTNLALCIEMFLKFLLIYDDISFEKIHNLDKLYSNLTKFRKEEIMNNFNEPKLKSSEIESNILNTLSHISKCAVTWRYLESGSSFSPKFMFELATILNNMTNNLYNKNTSDS